MKHPIHIPVFRLLLAAMAAWPAAASADDPVRIMRIGDSITWQMSGDATLEQLLDVEGIAYEFVGTQNWYDDGGYVPVELAREENQDTEGYPAMKVEWFTDPDFLWYTWLARPTTIVKGDGNTPIRHALTSNPPDIILLMIGTNNTDRDKDGVRGESSSAEIDAAFLAGAYGALLDAIEELAPQAHTIVAELPVTNDTGGGNRFNRAERTLNFNLQVVRPLVQARIDAGKPFSLVDFYPLLDVPDDFHQGTDTVHPGLTGIPKLNTAWFHAILGVVAPSGFAAWIAGFDGLTEDQRGAQAAPAGDGIPNLLKYAVAGMSPLESGRHLLPRPAIDAGEFTYAVPLRAEAQGIQVVFERFVDGSWEAIAAAAGGEDNLASLRLPLPEAGALLVRFKVR
jgi:hypothetical protein